MKKDRKEYMSAAHKASMGSLPRTHANCIEKTGVARPGKTAKDRDRAQG